MQGRRSVPVPVEPGGVFNPGARTKGEAIGPASGGGDEPWTAAPAGSHVHSFRWFPASKYPALVSFPGKLGPVSLLYVRFKDKEGGVAAECAYGFADESQGRSVFEAMAASQHPYSEVFNLRVRKANVPFQYV